MKGLPTSSLTCICLPLAAALLMLAGWRQVIALIRLFPVKGSIIRNKKHEAVFLFPLRVFIYPVLSNTGIFFGI